MPEQPEIAALVDPPLDNVTSQEEDRRCNAIKGNGDRCGAWALKDGTGLCAGHGGLGVAASPDIARAAQAKGVATRTEQVVAARMTLKQRLAEGIEANAAAFEARLLDIIAHGSDADALRAMDTWMSRVLGKPKETIETVTIPSTITALQGMDRAARLALLHKLEADGTMPRLLAVGE